jgi:hypothetical protein
MASRIMTSIVDTAALRRLLEKATPRPWEAVTQDDPRGQPSVMYRSLICTVEHAPERYLAVVQEDGLTVSRDQWPANARLIPAAVNALPALLAEVERRRADDPVTEEAREAAERIVRAHEAIEKAKAETHPSFKDAVKALAYHELHASAREGALIVARALLAKVEESGNGK